MSGVRTSSRHHERPSSARRHSRDDDNTHYTEERRAHASAHRHRNSSSSGRNSPHRHSDAALLETQRFRPEDYVLEEGVPPLRRQSTQPPHRRTSPTGYHRREVEATGTPHARRASPPPPVHSTALVVAGERRTSPRGSRHDSRIESEDGVVRSPRQHPFPAATSPRRHHRQTGSPIRPERRTVSSPHRTHRHRDASAEPHARSPHSSARRPRDGERTARQSVPEATLRQDTLRYRSPPLLAEAPHRSSSRRAHRSSDATAAADSNGAEKQRSSSRRHSHADRPSSRHGERTSSRHADRPASRHASERRHSSRHRQASADSSVAPREPSHMQTSGAAKGSAAPVAGGSTYVRPSTTNGHISTRRSSGSYIEVISVNSARPGSSHSWVASRNSAPQSPRRPREVGPPVVIPDPRGVKLMQRIDSTRNWIKNMKEEVDKDREREMQEKRAAEAATVAAERAAAAAARQQQEAEREEAARRQEEAERARRERHRTEEVGRNSARRHRSSSNGSQRRPHSSRKDSNGTAAPPPPVLVEPERTVDSRRYARNPIAPAAASAAPRVGPGGAAARSATRSPHAPSASTRTAPSDRDGNSSRHHHHREPAKPVTAPPAPAPAPVVLHDTMVSSRQGGFDDPVFSFISFLDGNTFDSTAGMCEYNTQVAEGLSDDHLDLLREALFHHDEDAFAELLYGDDVQAELDVIVNTLGHSEDPAVQREIVVLQRAAVRRFNDKCSAALRTLLTAPGGLADAVQIAASELERQAYEAGAANSP